MKGFFFFLTPRSRSKQGQEAGVKAGVKPQCLLRRKESPGTRDSTLEQGDVSRHRLPEAGQDWSRLDPPPSRGGTEVVTRVSPISKPEGFTTLHPASQRAPIGWVPTAWAGSDVNAQTDPSVQTLPGAHSLPVSTSQNKAQNDPNQQHWRPQGLVRRSRRTSGAGPPLW